MIYYPLSTLMLAGIRDILVISTPKDTPVFEEILGDGARFGVKFSYIVQDRPAGIAQAFLLGEKFIGADNVTLVLGDNIFYGNIGHVNVIKNHRSGAVIFGYAVTNPQEFGVIEFNKQGKAISIEEKPAIPKSKYAVPGLYVYDNQVIDICRNLRPSGRGELEITDVNMEYLRRSELTVMAIGRGAAWLDTGTTSALAEASTFIEIVEKRQGLKIGCPEEIAVRFGYVTLSEFQKIVEALPKCQYREYLEGVGQELGQEF